MKALDVFRTLPRVSAFTGRRHADREHAVRVRLGIERRAERPIPGTGIVRGMVIGALMWAAIIAAIFALTGCATTRSGFESVLCPTQDMTSAACLEDPNQAVWDSTSQVTR